MNMYEINFLDVTPSEKSEEKTAAVAGLPHIILAKSYTEAFNKAKEFETTSFQLANVALMKMNVNVVQV